MNEINKFLKKSIEFGTAADLLHDSPNYMNNVVTQEVYYTCFLRLQALMSKHFFTDKAFKRLVEHRSNKNTHYRVLQKLEYLVRYFNLLEPAEITDVFGFMRVLRTTRNNATYKAFFIEDNILECLQELREDIFMYCKLIDDSIRENPSNYKRINYIHINEKKEIWTIKFEGEYREEVFYM